MLAVVAGHVSGVTDDYWGEMEVDRLEVRTSGRVAPVAFRPEKLRDYFARAGGRFVSEEYDGALADFEVVRRGLADRPGAAEELYGSRTREDWESEISFIAAFAHLHAGRATEAAAELRRVFAAGLPRALMLFKRNFAAMPEDEVGLFRRLFRESTAAQAPEEAFSRTLQTVSAHPNGGLQVVEALFFTDAADPAASLGLLDRFVKAFESYGPRSKAVWHRARARLLRQAGRKPESLDELRRGLAAIDHPDVDAFNRYPLKRSLEELLAAWSR
jgi:hypothetical protein